MDCLNGFKMVLLGEAEWNYEPTVGVSLNRLTFRTDRGGIPFIVWDTAGQEKLAGMRDGYYIQAHCAIIMFDVTSRKSYDKLERWHRDLVRVCNNIPIVICGNKVDLREKRQVEDTQVRFHRKKNLMYFNISAKSSFNLDKPFIYLARQLLNDRKLRLVEQPAIPKMIMSPELCSQSQDELMEAKA
ncbi:GTP-binding nuclear protein Ran-like [Drosophila gunungcola]|uniref:GTP-binding nuclear protein n=1 Tax=Drosophila gunungcola TaxID=103775 RepID=A0A9Q0BSB5_9MUSC|nr:GTP-binding nuclear protein Ran-like [Drosophila gunungcola]KAI8042802.1 hypothetical protein M5D96_004125 [Drosophila gunungcola]